MDLLIDYKSLLDYTNLFSSKWLWKEWQNNTKISSITTKMKKLCCIICGKYRKLEKPIISYLLEKTLVLLLFTVSTKMKVKSI